MAKALKNADGALAHKLLEALAKAGTSHAVPYVERFAHTAKTVRLRDAAAAALEILRSRKASELDHSRLLRPSEHSTAQDYLLRPAGAGSVTPSSPAILEATFAD